MRVCPAGNKLFADQLSVQPRCQSSCDCVSWSFKLNEYCIVLYCIDCVLEYCIVLIVYWNIVLYCIDCVQEYCFVLYWLSTGILYCIVLTVYWILMNWTKHCQLIGYLFNLIRDFPELGFPFQSKDPGSKCGYNFHDPAKHWEGPKVIEWRRDLWIRWKSGGDYCDWLSKHVSDDQLENAQSDLFILMSNVY